MASNLEPRQISLRQAVGEVLHYLWDPIGVAGVPQARDEYDGYADHICSMLCHDIDKPVLVRHLVQIAEQQMGLSGTEDRAELAAGRLLKWRDELAR